MFYIYLIYYYIFGFLIVIVWKFNSYYLKKISVLLQKLGYKYILIWFFIQKYNLYDAFLILVLIKKINIKLFKIINDYNIYFKKYF